MIRIQAGSRAFFSGMEGFVPHDSDVVCVCGEGEHQNFLYKRSFPNKQERGCEFHIVLTDKDKLIRWELKHGRPMCLGHYLLPEFCQLFGITLEDFEKLRPLYERLDKFHLYERIIFDAYIENGEMTLTERQRKAAFDEYLNERKK